MQLNMDLTLLREYQKYKADNISIACSSSLRVYKIPLQSLYVFIVGYNLTYVKEKIIASSNSSLRCVSIQFSPSYACQSCIFQAHGKTNQFYVTVSNSFLHSYSSVFNLDRYLSYRGYCIHIMFFIKAPCLVCTSCCNLYQILKPAAISYSFCMTKVMLCAADGKALRLNLSSSFQSLVVCLLHAS